MLGLSYGDPREVDHISGDRLDNRRSNLRIITKGEQRQNQRSRPGSSSRYRGVYREAKTGKWRVCIRWRKRNHHLGGYDSEDEAGRIAEAFRREHMPYAVDR